MSPPARGDREARREDVSQAVWQVLAAKGFGGLTLRSVASEMGVSTGMLMHYFPAKRALVQHALDLLEKRSAERPRRERTGEGLTALRAIVLDVLPLTEDGVVRSRIWVSSWDLALNDDELGGDQAARYRRMREALVPHLGTARSLGELPEDADLDQLAAATVAFTHGLVVQALFDPQQFPADVLTAAADAFLASLRGAGAPAAVRT